MSTMFRKGAPVRKAPDPKKAHAAPAKPKFDKSKTPATRVGLGRDHCDSIATRILHVLVDDSKQPESSVALDQDSKRFSMQFTTNAEPLADTNLVFAMTFEPLADCGKLTLTYRHSGSQWDVYLFKDVDFKDLFLHDPDLVFGPKVQEAKEPPDRRTLDYGTVPMPPNSGDPDLSWPDPPLVSLIETGPKGAE